MSLHDKASQAAGPAMAPDFGDLEKDRAVRFEIDGRWRVHELTTVLAANSKW